ncbi:MAG TPA: MarR family transcriptional regulator [Steroidobacteraceae bacterium]|jgi:DNA-binding MarR family transcriptional regulator
MSDADQTGLEIVGNLLQEFVNRVSHAQGKTLGVLADASVTLPQVLLLRRVAAKGESIPSGLAEQMHMSLPAVSQMLDRLFELGLVSRKESTNDRRKKVIAARPEARSLLKRIHKARSADYSAGIASLSPRVRETLALALRDALQELRDPNEGEVRRSGASPS